MKNFKEMGIARTEKGFTGDKIKMKRVLNVPIIVYDFKVETSRFQEKGNGKVLTLQIELDNTKHIVFTGSRSLMDVIEKVSKADFPFQTTIIEENERFQFS